ncbi:MAG TPA: tetratricopeptide repeat protein [Stellaceae bacterium]|nr:tetratricopeptide repeat protein [Stellaceae bacterium]
MEPANRHQRRLARKQPGAKAGEANDAVPRRFREALRCQKAGDLDQAERLCREILALDPRHADSFHLLGVVAHQAGRSDIAVAPIERAIALRSGVAAYHNSLGLALRAQGKLDAASAQYRLALALAPNLVQALSNLGLVLQAQDKLDEAVACFERAIAIEPGFAVAHHNLGVVLRVQGRLDAAFAAYRRYAALRVAKSDAGERRVASAAAGKIRHDLDQLDYLLAAHPDEPRFRQIQAAAAATPERFPALFEALFHLEGGARVAPAAVNPALDVAAIEARWAESRPQIVVIDEFLTPPALAELRRFCWGSTVWRVPYPNGYLGAFLGDGFACPLLAQIVGELAAKLPGVIQRHPLTQLWGFKYDREQRGINIHADVAAVNVNFWIAADDANLDPESGGLVIWDVPAPLDWSFEKYQNNDARDIRALLAANNARPTTVPYRCNRAVVFDSDLFHETDRFAFQEGYRNRRINVTMLYGLRHHTGAA